MAKKTSLTAALSDPAPEQPAQRTAPPSRVAPVRPDRENKTNITGYYDMPVKWELQDLATERSRRLGGTSFFAKAQTIDPHRLCLAGGVLYWVRAGSMPSSAKTFCWIGVGRA
jgi:hypothetical protein